MAKQDDYQPQSARLEREKLQFRLVVCTLIMGALFALLAMRLWQVQVLQGADHLKRAQRQMIRPVRLTPVRGRIYTRDGEALVDNAPHYDLVFYVSEMRQPGKQRRTIEYILETDRNISMYLGRQPTLTREAVLRQLERQPVLPLSVQKDLTATELAAWSECLPHVPGVDIEMRVERSYPYPGILSQVLGFTSWQRPAGDDILEDLPRLYVTPELVGRSGLEAAFNQELSGQPAARLVMVDSIGYARRIVSADGDPAPGHDLTLTIDLKAQQLADELLRGYYGAIVLLDVQSGAVLAMASSPSYSLAGLSSSEIAELSQDAVRRPMFNRATRGVYTPGSIVKPLMALTALETQPELAAETYDCVGKYTLGNHSIHCARRWGHGIVDLQQAVTVSCNPFFINLGLAVGIESYSEVLEAAGLGSHSGIEIGDAEGIRPERSYARRAWKRNWLSVDTAYAAIGQGAISITPLQAAVFTAAIANGGIVYKPYLVQEIHDCNGRLLRTAAPEIRQRLPVSDEHIAAVQAAMESVVTGRDASAAALQHAGISLAAKTGTAEVGSGANKYKNTWVIAFGPTDEPRYAFACVIERGQSGSQTAVPLAAEFFKRWTAADE